MIRQDRDVQHDTVPHTSLAGRERELSTLRGCLARARAGNGGLVLLAGEAGIGKTTLVRAIGREANAGDATVHASACYDLTATPPYGPWLEIYSGLTDDSATLPGSLQTNQSAEWAVSQDALFADAMDILTSAASQQPRVLVLEDLHWADPASLELMRYAARRLDGLPALVIGTYRDTEIDRDTPLHAILPALVRESEATRISLRPLDDDSVAALLDQHYALSSAERARLLDYLQDRAEGNPFYICEILRSLEENGVLHYQAGMWTVGDLRQTPVPSLVRQVIDGRLEQLGPENRILLSIAAALGKDISLDVWRETSGADVAQLASVVRDAVKLNILEETAAPATMQFTHALIREALYYEFALPERRQLHRAIGEAQERQSAVDPDAIAFHFQQAQDERAVDWLMRAGERAQQMYAWRTAAERFTSALELTAHDELLARSRAWLCYRIGLLLTYADPDSGIQRLQQAERTAEAVGDRHLSAYARADRGLLRCLTGDVRRGLAEMQSGVNEIGVLAAADDTDGHEPGAGLLSVASIRRETLRLVSSADDVNVREGTLVFWLAWAGRYHEAIAVGESFVEKTRQISGRLQDVRGDALAGLGHAFAALGRPDDALTAFARARDAYGVIDHHFKVGNTAIYELSEAFLPYRADRIMQREWLADQAEAG